MELYYKKYNEYPVNIPKKSIILRDWDVEQLESNYPAAYPTPLCLEVDGINKINRNEDGYFDFSKSIIDIGADLGEYCWLTQFSHAYAFEPNKESAFALCANALLWERVYDIDIFQEVLSDSRKKVKFDGFAIKDGDDSCVVKTSTLDSFRLKNIGMIKIDVENHEYEVLCGAKKTIKRNGYPPIVFECFDVGVFGMSQERHDNTFGFLESLGYTILEKWIDRNTHLAVKL